MEKLKPCPFCGGEAVTIRSKTREIRFNGLDERFEYTIFSVRCNKCHARGSTVSGWVGARYLISDWLTRPEWATTRGALIREAVELWNRRAHDAEIR